MHHKLQTNPTNAVRRFRQGPAIGVIAAVALATAGAAQAQTRTADRPADRYGYNQYGWYVGANLGGTDVSYDTGVGGAFASQGATGTGSIDKSDTTYGFNAGYQFNRNFAVEAGYVNLGKYSYNGTITAPAAGTASGDLKIDGGVINAVGILPFSNGFAAYGKVGAFYSRSRLSGGGPNFGSRDEKNTDWTYGLGASYDFTRNWVGKAEWTRYQSVGSSSTMKSDIDTYTVGVAYHF